MRVRIPYVLFETKTGKYGVDAYFSLRVAKLKRRATLIRKADDLEWTMDRPPVLLLDDDGVENYFGELFLALYELSGEGSGSELTT